MIKTRRTTFRIFLTRPIAKCVNKQPSPRRPNERQQYPWILSSASLLCSVCCASWARQAVWSWQLLLPIAAVCMYTYTQAHTRRNLLGRRSAIPFQLHQAREALQTEPNRYQPYWQGAGLKLLHSLASASFLRC